MKAFHSKNFIALGDANFYFLVCKYKWLLTHCMEINIEQEKHRPKILINWLVDYDCLKKMGQNEDAWTILEIKTKLFVLNFLNLH